MTGTQNREPRRDQASRSAAKGSAQQDGGYMESARITPQSDRTLAAHVLSVVAWRDAEEREEAAAEMAVTETDLEGDGDDRQV